LGLFDERNLCELTDPEHPGERLIACRNPDLAHHRAKKRQALITATEKALEKIRARVNRRTLRGKGKIGMAIGKVLNRYKVGKHFDLDITSDRLSFAVNAERVAAEAAIDGVY